MSLTAMVKRQALAAKSKPPKPQQPRTLRQELMAGGESDAEAPAPPAPADADKDPGKSAISALAHYIPTEIVAVYIAAVAATAQIAKAIAPAEDGDTTGKTADIEGLQNLIFGGCVVLIPVFVALAWIAERKTMEPDQRASLNPPVWPITAGVLSFVVWSLAMPGQILIDPVYQPMVAVLALLSSSLLQAVEKALPEDWT